MAEATNDLSADLATGNGVPKDGDIVVSADPVVRSRFLVCQVPGTPQMIWPTRAAAVASAKEFARRQAVDLWIDDGVTTTRQPRPATPSPAVVPPRAPRPAMPEARRGSAFETGTRPPSNMTLNYYARPRRRI